MVIAASAAFLLVAVVYVGPLFKSAMNLAVYYGYVSVPYELHVLENIKDLGD